MFFFSSLPLKTKRIWFDMLFFFAAAALDNLDQETKKLTDIQQRYRILLEEAELATEKAKDEGRTWYNRYSECEQALNSAQSRVQQADKAHQLLESALVHERNI
jgi:hypothetical protein